MTTFSTSLVPVSIEKPARRNLDFFVGEIGARWHKMTDGILDVASLCVEAMRTLCPEDRKALHGRLRFSKGTISKLVKIGNDERLRPDYVRKRLPPSYTTIYAISGLTDDQLYAAVEAGVIHLDMHRADLDVWLGKSQDPNPEVIFNLIALEEIPEGRLAMLQERLRKVLVDFPEVEAQSRDKKWTFRSYFRIVPEAEAA